MLFANSKCADEIAELAKNLELFDFVPNVRTPEEYGKYMIKESGTFNYDPYLEDCYDYVRYAEHKMAEHHGQFNERGYISCSGTLSMDELLRGDSAEVQELGM